MRAGGTEVLTSEGESGAFARGNSIVSILKLNILVKIEACNIFYHRHMTNIPRIKNLGQRCDWAKWQFQDGNEIAMVPTRL